mmetsp:Transcript_23337/g.65558  ORF Transcript_23337/g.65558 Transcript_23337/m.65558 type:complete len:171 (+) Transcript_23337:165-677(+)|eukprot:CAMPEP_0119133036 /NCGR_PEP_ID=MMETSP1310-20130426/12837_1 /TAXON_ID=464262 /ORGANISM="Genus nov. species nov., Strain RCC2339" /LENGTH=170 /DNA_ID=CAMNT_0007123707 /DNA_START=89 /DNA_END=601 /DNA_ORIENTATION=+
MFHAGGYKQKKVSEIVFEKYDTDGNGTINGEEFRFACYDMGHHMSEEQLAVALHKVDRNGDGSISYAEWLEWWRANNRFGALKLEEKELAFVTEAVSYFRYFDKDNSGALSHDEFPLLHADLLKNGYGAHIPADPSAALKALDTSNDSEIDLFEYVQWLVKIGQFKPSKV